MTPQEPAHRHPGQRSQSDTAIAGTVIAGARPATSRAQCALEMLATAADTGAPCPPQRALADMLGSRDLANAALAELVRHHFVIFERSPDGRQRRCFVYAQPHMRAGWTDWGDTRGGQCQQRNRMPGTPPSARTADLTRRVVEYTHIHGQAV